MWDNKWRGLDVDCIDGNFYVKLRDLERKFDSTPAEEQARVILKHLDKYFTIDPIFEEFYIKAIVAGLAEIDRA